jgi:chromosome segregation ATPase
MPKMFGDEKYAFSLVDIEDPRYVQEASLMGRKLTRLNYEKQIVDMEWTRTYKSLLRAEKHEQTLGGGAAEMDKRREKRSKEIKEQIEDFKSHLLTLQEQKDMYEGCIEDIWNRCHQIKESIRAENDLESLRKELSARVQQQHAPDDEFWGSKFSLEGCRARAPGREWELAIME